MKPDNNKNRPDTPYTGIRPIHRVKVEESTQHKWVNNNIYLFLQQTLYCSLIAT